MSEPRWIDFEDCTRCSGTGFIEAGQWPCPDCDGMGVVDVELKDEED